MNLIKKLFPFILILIFSFFAYKPLLNPGFFPIHDNTQVARVYEITKALKDGMLPVRWSLDLGYSFGYPLFNFYDPLPYYFGGLLGLVGFDSLISTKIIILLGLILSGFSMYLFSKEYFGKNGAIFSSLLYVYAPYHALDTYVRGDVAEIYAYALIPLIFYGFFNLYKRFQWKYAAVVSLAYAGLISSHNLTALFSTPFIVLYVFYLIFNSKSRAQVSKNLFASFVLGILIASFYWIPAIFEMKYTNILSQVGGGADFKDHFVCLSQLWSSPWAFGGSAKGCIDGLSFMVGKAHIILTFGIFFAAIILASWKKYTTKLKVDRDILITLIFFFCMFIISLFFTLDFSKQIWISIKPMAFIQYPWRFLILASFFASFIGGFLIYLFEKYFKNEKLSQVFLFFTLITTIFLNAKFFIPQRTLNLKVADYVNKYQLNWVVSKTSDEYMPKGFQKPKSYYEIPDPNNLVTPDISAKFIKIKTQEINLNLNVKKPGKYIFPIAFFPAWKAYINKIPLELKENPHGVSVDLPQGQYDLRFKFNQTPIELTSNLLSLSGILILFVGIIYLRSKHE